MAEETAAPKDSETQEASPPVESEQGESQANVNAASKPGVSSIIETAKKVILDPVGFFKEMPKTGGLADPLVFVAALALVSGVLTVILSLFKFSSFAAIILFPIGAVIGSFIAGAIMFVIWKLMGSERDFEAAYRCTAYSFAIHPIVVVLGLIPYIGTTIGLLWGLYLVVVASVEVHSIRAKTAWIVFGILTAISIISNIRAERFRRKIEDSLPSFTMNTGSSSEDMTPEEAGRAVGEFFRGIQEAAEEKESE
jgi:hypothetical protein